MKTHILYASAGLYLLSAAGFGGEPTDSPGAGNSAPAILLPRPPHPADFEALRASSPFSRTLNLSDTFVLTGIARIEGNAYAALFDREERRTTVVTADSNREGLRLVEVEGDESDLESVTARIALRSGEMFAIRYAKEQLRPEDRRPGDGRRPDSDGSPRSWRREPSDPEDYRNRVASDGFRGPPPPELVEKLSRLDRDTRARVINGIYDIHRRNPELPSETRQQIFRRMVDRALQP